MTRAPSRQLYYLFDFVYFSDFEYSTPVKEENIFKMYEAFLGVGKLDKCIDYKKELQYIKKNFRNLMPPKHFCKEFAWSNYNIE